MSILDEYEYLSIIGKGYFSIVKKYKHLVSGQLFAVKELRKEFNSNEDYKHRFCKEIECLQRLSGISNIIELIEFEKNESRYLYIMPVASMNLLDYIKRNNAAISLETRLEIFDQIIIAIKTSHEKQILHRDICPQNVLLFIKGEEISVKMSDFGLGKNLEANSSSTRSDIAYYGHLDYVAPEQKKKLKNATIRSDIFSLGKLLFFIITGKDPDNLTSCEFSSVILRATSYEPESRYDDVSEFQKYYEQNKLLLAASNSSEVSSFVNAGSQGEIHYNWLAFHLFALNGNYQGHVYHSYIQPIISALSDDDNLKGYCSIVENALEEFLNAFIESLHVCFQTTGWPFTATTSFGDLLKRIFYISSNSRVKIQCLKELWDIAYEKNQFGVQNIIESLLDGQSIPPSIQTEFAMYILESPANINLERFIYLKIPKVIMAAIKQTLG